MDSINVFIARRYSDYVPTIKEIYNECNIYLTDSRLRPDKNINYSVYLSIILCDEGSNDRGTISDWLNRTTLKIRENSKRVIVLLYGGQAEDYENMKVICLRETIDDDYNQEIIKQHLLNYNL
jgi:hypothetical protein